MSQPTQPDFQVDATIVVEILREENTQIRWTNTLLTARNTELERQMHALVAAAAEQASQDAVQSAEPPAPNDGDPAA